MLPCQFGLGTFTDLTYADGVVLDGQTTGTFTSRVFVLPTGATQWEGFGWSPAAPYRKPLIDNQGAEVDYAEGRIDMRDNAVLLHLDGNGFAAEGQVLADASGRGNDFTLVSSPTAGAETDQYVTGLFGAGLRKDKDLYGEHVFDAGDDLQFGGSDFTWLLWAQPTYCSPDNTTFWGNEDLDIQPHIWMGCGPCANGDGLKGYYRGTGDMDVIGGCAEAGDIRDGAWHHVAVVKSSPGPGTVRYAFYSDGRAGDVIEGPADPDATYTESPAALDFLAFNIERFPDSPAVGTFDEAAIFHRALSAEELAAVWSRGALDLGLQIRFCTAPDCSDNPPFVGPDGTTLADFADTGQQLNGPPLFPLAEVGDVASLYVQYRATFSSARPDATPRLLGVTFTAR